MLRGRRRGSAVGLVVAHDELLANGAMLRENPISDAVPCRKFRSAIGATVAGFFTEPRKPGWRIRL
jgi:hypothetical protein